MSAVDPVPWPSAGDAEPVGMVVALTSGERIAYLRWDGPAGATPLLLIHGLARTSWSWSSVARRLRTQHSIALPDLRGHGMSDAPREGYGLESLALDMLTVVAAEGWGEVVGGSAVVVGGHGLGAMVGVTMAGLQPGSVAGLVLVDGGWEEFAETTRLSPPELLAAMADPPDVLASMERYLADRRDFDPATWDADQERAARSAVDEKHAGHVAPVVRASVMRRLVETLYAYQPLEALAQVACPVTVLVAGAGTADDEERRERLLALEDAQAARAAAGRSPIRVVRLDGAGHELMRYRPAEVADELSALASIGVAAPVGDDQAP